MISSINSNTNIKNRIYFRATTQDTDNTTKAEPQKTQQSSNLITQYLDNLSTINSAQIQQNNTITTPSGVKNYNNYQEIDNLGNKIVDLSHTQDGDFIIQKLNIKTVNGSTIERSCKQNDITGSNAMTFCIKDIEGNILLQREKSYTKINEDTAQSTVNGKKYNISGLKGHVITVEHNGDVTTIDLEKILNNEVLVSDDPSAPKPQITEEEKEKLFAKVKELNGDDLIRFAQSVEKLQYFAGMDSFFFHNDKSMLLQTKDIFGKNVTVHELGHAYNFHNEKIGEKRNPISDGENFEILRQQGQKDYLATPNPTPNDKRFYGKFIDTNQCKKYYNDDENIANSNLRDEIYAESYNILNNSEIVDYENDMGCPGRIISLMKYLPMALVETNKTL